MHHFRFAISCLAILGLFISLSSCDPERVILIKNNGEQTIQVDILLNDCEESEAFSFLEGEHFRNINIGLDGENMHIIHMGMGTWSEEEMMEVLDCIASIEVLKNDGEALSIDGEALMALKDLSVESSTKNYIELSIPSL